MMSLVDSDSKKLYIDEDSRVNEIPKYERNT